MTEATAKSIFDLLLTEVRSQGFTGIGGFMIEEVPKDLEFEEFTEAYTYLDSDTVIDETELMSNRPQGSLSALTLLLDASIDYFTLAARIPSRFQEQMDELAGDKAGDYPILIETTNEREENLSERLSSPAVKELLNLLLMIRENMDKDDERILQLINES